MPAPLPPLSRKERAYWKNLSRPMESEWDGPPPGWCDLRDVLLRALSDLDRLESERAKIAENSLEYLRRKETTT